MTTEKNSTSSINNFEEPSCMLCGTGESEEISWASYHLNLIKPAGVGRCKKCGILFLSPRPHVTLRRSLMKGLVPAVLRDYGDESINYSSVSSGRRYLFESRLQLLEQLLSKSSANHKSLLDVGASSGTFVHQARQRGWSAEGIEPSVEGVSVALVKGIQLSQGCTEALPFSSESFDVVHSHHVFEHLENPLIAATECWRVLKPGGLFFIEVPNQLDNIMIRRDILFKRVPQRERNIRSIHHLWFFSRHTLNVLLKKAGFLDVKVKDGYSWRQRGWRIPFSLVTRFIGYFIYGGDILQGIGWKQKN
jgi:SAM-dependent methyltransferase